MKKEATNLKESKKAKNKQANQKKKGLDGEKQRET